MRIADVCLLIQSRSAIGICLGPRFAFESRNVPQAYQLSDETLVKGVYVKDDEIYQQGLSGIGVTTGEWRSP